MATLPQSVIRLANDASDANPEDVPRAVCQAMDQITALPEYPELVRGLIEHAVRELVYARRHALNRATKVTLGSYHTTTKAQRGGPAVRQAYSGLYEYHLAGKVLGSMTRDDLCKTAESERRIAGGHQFNALLCERLAQRVPQSTDDVKHTVKSCVTLKTLEEIFSVVYSQTRETEPAA